MTAALFKVPEKRMVRGWLLAFLVTGFLSIPTQGCATVITIVGVNSPHKELRFRPWSGTWVDFTWLQAKSSLAFLGLLDLPLSFALDTALLPVSVTVWALRSEEELDLTPSAEPAETDDPPPEYLTRQLDLPVFFVGLACEMDGRTVIILDDDQVIRLKGVESWPPDSYQKRVDVSGVLRWQDPPPLERPDGKLQPVDRVKFVIENPTWTVAEKQKPSPPK